MNIQIKLVKECSKGEYGTCQIINKNTILVEISESKNKDKYEFFVTVLHELIHAWVFIMKANGVKMSIKKEHKWIYSVQAVIIKALTFLKRD